MYFVNGYISPSWVERVNHLTQKYLIHESVELEEFIEWTKLILITGDDASLPTIPKHLRIDACRTCLTSYWVLSNSTLHTIRFDSIRSRRCKFIPFLPFLFYIKYGSFNFHFYITMTIQTTIILTKAGLWRLCSKIVVIKPHSAAPQCCLNPLLITDNGKKDS